MFNGHTVHEWLYTSGRANVAVLKVMSHKTRGLRQNEGETQISQRFEFDYQMHLEIHSLAVPSDL